MKRVLKWGLGGVLFLALLIVAAGVGWEQWIRGKLARELPPPGRLVEVEGRAMHLRCAGEGRPTIVLEAGLGADGSTSWDPVFDELAQVSRACAYDRAGILWSAPGPDPRDALQVTSELRALLASAGEESPFVLVGHSLGGLFARIYTDRYPDDVAGLVFVDSSHPEQFERMPPEVVEAMESAMPPLAAMRFLAATGALRFMTMGAGGGADGATAPVQARLPQSVAGLAGEASLLETIATQAGEVTSLGDRPLVVLAAGSPPLEVPEGVAPEVVERMQTELWPELQREAAALSTRGEFRLVEGAGHYIHHDQPQVVIQAIREVVSAVRGAATATGDPVRPRSPSD